MEKKSRFFRKTMWIIYILLIICIGIGSALLGGWFNVMVYVGKGYQGGDETSRGGMFFDSEKGVEYDLTVDFEEVEGDVWIEVYDTNYRPDQLITSKNGFHLIDKIEVLEPGEITVDIGGYSLDRVYLVQVRGSEDCQYRFTMEYKEYNSRIVKMEKRIKSFISG